DVKAIGYIVIELIQKYYKDNSAISLKDFSKYLSNSNIVDFLAATTSATLVKELLRVSSPLTKTILYFRLYILV
ncbi:hypothetical protein BKA61DRAFT_482129, partial [Leptodontidium sp. MPI-SDFR-AT-0119]